MFAHISTPGILLCVKMGSMNGFIVDCSRYLSCFHIINQSGNALQSSQSEEVLLSMNFLAVYIPNWPISAHYRCCRFVSFNWLERCIVMWHLWDMIVSNSLLEVTWLEWMSDPLSNLDKLNTTNCYPFKQADTRKNKL